MPRSAKQANGLTLNQNRFAQHYAKHNNQGAAYRHAYNTAKMKPGSISTAANKLVKDERVAGEIARLESMILDAAVDSLIITVETQSAKLERVIHIAEKKGQTATMVSAIMGQAKLHKLLDDTGDGNADPYLGMTAAEIRKRRIQMEKLLKEDSDTVLIKAV